MYKYEMHLHSCGTSACGVSEAQDYIAAAKEHGYAGMVFTNHFYRGNTAVSRDIPWRDFVEAYREEYLRAAQAGAKEDIDVIFGLEEGYGKGKECLIYGLSPETVAAERSFGRMPINELSAFVRENGGFIACAHPFRQRVYILSPDEEPNPELFDAVEVYNRGNSLEDNLKAEVYAKKYKLPVISGGDVHCVSGFGTSGVAFNERVSNGAALVKLLKAGAYRLLASKSNGNVGELYDYE